MLNKLQPVTNFSKDACKSRYEALKDGTAKPTPESILNPDDHIQARIAARKAREAKIEADVLNFRTEVTTNPQEDMIKANYEGNGWVSKRISYK